MGNLVERVDRIEYDNDRLRELIGRYIEENRRGMKELREAQAETDRQIKENNRGIEELREAQAETSKQIKENNRSIIRLKKLLKENAKEIREAQKRTDEQINKTDRQIENLLKKTKEYEDNWSKLVQAMFEDSTEKALAKYGISVHKIAKNYKVKDDQLRVIMEIDVVLSNNDTLVLVEVKTTLRKEDVDDHINRRLKNFLLYHPEHINRKVYGGVAYINAVETIDSYAANQGLFLFTLTFEDEIIIKNSPDFVPKDFSKIKPTEDIPT